MRRRPDRPRPDRPRHVNPALGAAVGMLLAAIGGVSAGIWMEDRGLADLAATGRHRLDLYALTLRAAIGRHDALPFVLAHSGDIRSLLVAPTAPAIADANDALEQLAAEVSVAALYVMDYTGHTLAASNWQTPGSFVGQNYAFRPYFADAMRLGRGRYFGVGVTTGQPGYFLAAQVRDANGSALGVVAAKLELGAMAQGWQAAGDSLLLTDAKGVIFLSSRAEWTYHTLTPLDPMTLEALRSSQQYATLPIQPAALRADGQRAEGVLLRDGNSGPQYLQQSLDLPDHDWRLHLLSPTAGVRGAAWTAGLLAAAGIVILTLLALYADQAAAARRAARLAAINRRLEAEIAERVRTETDLRAAQEDLVQASKLAALGQMSAALAHEINQPLAALQTYLASARALLDRGEVDKADSSLTRMAALIGRISGLTQHLKRFARKAPPDRAPLPLRQAVENALALFENRLLLEDVQVALALPPSLTAWGDGVRLEQVLVNLIGNALDAMADQPVHRLEITSLPSADDSVRLTLADSGPGIAPEVLPRLFTPFVTTKPVGQGLGLGLVVSRSIIEEMGGHLTVENRPPPAQGAVFTLTLPAREGRPA